MGKCSCRLPSDTLQVRAHDVAELARMVMANVVGKMALYQTTTSCSRLTDRQVHAELAGVRVDRHAVDFYTVQITQVVPNGSCGSRCGQVDCSRERSWPPWRRRCSRPRRPGAWSATRCRSGDRAAGVVTTMRVADVPIPVTRRIPRPHRQSCRPCALQRNKSRPRHRPAACPCQR